VGSKRTLPEKIVLATGNPGKVEEIRDLVADLPIGFLSLKDVPHPPEVIEDGETFEENALKKARETARAAGIPALADDSGLCVDALDGRPGVLSARYAGPDSSDESKYRRILEEMRDVPDGKRTARFVCVIALVYPDGEERIFRGVCEGRIAREPRGEGGFGYDPVFLHEDSDRTFAEIGRDAKNRVSHRGRALAAFADYLRELKA
jgi:XTP/dITP diphosphohydrolase